MERDQTVGEDLLNVCEVRIEAQHNDNYQYIPIICSYDMIAAIL